MGLKLSKKRSFPNKQNIIEFLAFYKESQKNKEILKLGHPMLDYFYRHYFEMMQFCRINKIPENPLWDVVRIYGEDNSCLCSKCNQKSKLKSKSKSESSSKFSSESSFESNSKLLP